MSQSNRSFTKHLCAAVSGLIALYAISASFGASAPDSKVLAEKIGLQRGICMVLGDKNVEVTLELARQSELTFYVQLESAEDVLAARKAGEKAGMLNTRIFVDSGPFSNLHLADNLADVVIAVSGSISEESKKEALRVLHPGGKLIVGDEITIKPKPDGLDDWTHPFHGPDNNPLSEDKFAGWPYIIQFYGGANYAPSPQVTVVSGGMIFQFNNNHVKQYKLASKWQNVLTGRNAYNGILFWKREISGEIPTYRRTMVASETALYFCEGSKCLLIDPITGKNAGFIEIPEEIQNAKNQDWLWIAIEDDLLFALFGDNNAKETIGKRFFKGIGRSLMAYDLKGEKVLWTKVLPEDVDPTAICMKNSRIYAFKYNSHLSSIDAKTGKILWSKTPQNDSNLFNAINGCIDKLNEKNMGMYDRKTFDSVKIPCVLRCNDKTLFFGYRNKFHLNAISTDDGSLLWSYPYTAYDTIILENELLAMAWDNFKKEGAKKEKESTKVFDLKTGKVLKELPFVRDHCARTSATRRQLFFLCQGEGTGHYNFSDEKLHISRTIRPGCNDGVIISNGMMYWTPSYCECGLTMYGMIGVVPLGDGEFSGTGDYENRLQKNNVEPAKDETTDLDWPAFRANNTCTVTSKATINESASKLWEWKSKDSVELTAPIVVGETVYLAGNDGIVRAIDSESGKLKWESYTGGVILYPPTYWKGSVLVGSADGFVYRFNAENGKCLWRFRSAPTERKIPVYGKLQSTWPVASGVLVDENGIAYFACGITHYSGTHVFGISVDSGQVKWHNADSGNVLNGSGVSVQGHLLLKSDMLFMPGGANCDLACYNTNDGKLSESTKIKPIGRTGNAGSELLLDLSGKIDVAGQPFYNKSEYPRRRSSRTPKVFMARASEHVIVWLNESKLLCYKTKETFERNDFIPKRSKGLKSKNAKIDPGVESLWEFDCRGGKAVAVTANAVIVAVENKNGGKLIALALSNGKPLWEYDLPAKPLPWGIAVDRKGKIIVSLKSGHVQCFR